MSFLSKLFGSGNKEPQEPTREEAVDYKGYKIVAAPQSEDKQWRMAGYIIKTTDNGDLERHFVRADIFYSREEAIEYTVLKGQQVIDQMADRIFANGEPTGRA